MDDEVKQALAQLSSFISSLAVAIPLIDEQQRKICQAIANLNKGMGILNNLGEKADGRIKALEQALKIIGGNN